MKAYEEYSLQKLQKRKMQLTIITGLCAVLIIAMGVYFGYELLLGNWKANNLIFNALIGILVVLVANLSVQLMAVSKALKLKAAAK